MVVAAMMFATNANAQIKFGLKGGLDVTNMSLSNDVFDASNKTGFFVGPMVKVTIPIVGLSFDAAALYDQKEAKVSVNDAETTMTQKSLNIPVNVRYGFDYRHRLNEQSCSRCGCIVYKTAYLALVFGFYGYDKSSVTHCDKAFLKIFLR